MSLNDINMVERKEEITSDPQTTMVVETPQRVGKENFKKI